MPMKKHKPEQIVALLRQVEVEFVNGKTTPQARKGRDHGADVLPLEKRVRRPEAGSSERMKELERENAKLKRLVAPLCGGACARKVRSERAT